MVEEIRTRWGAFIYRPQKPRGRRRPNVWRPALTDLLPSEKIMMTAAVWLSRLEGISSREIYEGWTWVEVWQQIAVHLAFHYTTDPG